MPPNPMNTSHSFLEIGPFTCEQLLLQAGVPPLGLVTLILNNLGMHGDGQ